MKGMRCGGESLIDDLRRMWGGKGKAMEWYIVSIGMKYWYLPAIFFFYDNTIYYYNYMCMWVYMYMITYVCDNIYMYEYTCLYIYIYILLSWIKNIIPQEIIYEIECQK